MVINSAAGVAGSGMIGHRFQTAWAQEGTPPGAATPAVEEAGHAHDEDEFLTAPAHPEPTDPLRKGWAGLAFIAGGEANKLWVVDAHHHKLVTAIDTGGPATSSLLEVRTQADRYPNLYDAHAMVWNKDFTRFYTVNSWEYEQSYALEFDPVTLRETRRAPAGEGGHHNALSPDDKFLYVANQYATTVSIIDTETMEKITDLEVGLGADYITPSMYWDGKVIETDHLFVSADKVPSVVAIDWRTNTVAKTIEVSGANHGVNITPDGTECWAAVGGGQELVIIDTKTLEVKDQLSPVAGAPIHVSFAPDSSAAYTTIATAEGIYLYKIDIASREVVWRAPGSGAHLMVSPDGKEAWTLNHTFEQAERYPYVLGGVTLSAVRVFDTDNGDWINEVVFERRPHEIQFVPYEAVGLYQDPSTVAESDAVPVPEGARRVTIIGQHDQFFIEDQEEGGSFTVSEGEVLQFEIVNRDDYLHNFLPSPSDPFTDFEPVNIDGLETAYVDYTVDVAVGTYTWVCTLHPGMQIDMVVE
jgi:YVTN family beta-propeller protein